MKIKEISYENLNLSKKISEIIDISNKEIFCFGIDYNQVENLILERFLDDGDFDPDWLIFLIKIVTEIIKDNDPAESVILQLENSLIHKIKNIKFQTLSLRLDDFIDTGFKSIDHELGFFIIWGLTEYTPAKIIKFKGLISPFADGQAIICIADKDDKILQYIKEFI